MDIELKQRLDDQDAKLAEIFKSTEKTRKYFLVIIWVSVIAVVLPLLGLLFAIPKFISTYSGAFEGLI